MLKNLADAIKFQINSRVLNQEQLTELALAAMFAGGHILIEGVPGLGKTLWARSLAQAVGVEFSRVQFMQDLSPAEIIGTKVLNTRTRRINIRKGSLFTQFFFADELNRATPQTQCVLLEAMEERAVTIGGKTYAMQEPFFVMATQSPAEHAGTYPLSEALADRFMMKIIVTYPGVAAEKQMLQMHHENRDTLNLRGLYEAGGEVSPVCGAAEIAEARREIAAVTASETVFNYIVRVVETTRRICAALCGASPRGGVALLSAAKAYAAVNGRGFVSPEDVRFLAPHILRHRLILKPEAVAEGITPDAVIESILSQIKF